MRIRFENGLTAILVENHAAPVVAFQAWVGVGSADESPGEAGIAHVFEHMLFKGTERRGVGQIAREVEASGGDINAWTSFDQTVYHLVLASRYFDTGLDILSDAVQRSSFDPEELKRELKVVSEEIRQGEDNPSRVLTQALFGTAFRRHPYRRPVIGTQRSVARVTRERLLDFFRRWYVPNNITLVVVGDFDTSEAVRKIEAEWRSAAARPFTRTQRREPEQGRPRQVVLRRDLRESHIALAFHIPGVRHDDIAALDLAAVVLGQGDSSRLNLAVRRHQQLVTEVYAYTYAPRDPGLLVVGASLPGGDPEPAFRAMLVEVFRLGNEVVLPDELAKAKTIVESDAIYQKETVQGQARKLGFYEVVAGGIEYEAEYGRRVQALSTQDLSEAARRYVRPDNMTVALLHADGGRRSEAKVNALRRRLERVFVEAARVKPRRLARVGPIRPLDAEVVRHVLPSGARILIKRDPSVPVVAFRAVWVGGLRYEDNCSNGINNLLAALVTRGTKAHTGEEIVREVEGMAGAIGGFSGRNSFGLRAEILAKNWERGLEILADCVVNPTFPIEEVEKERRQVLDELKAQEDNLTAVAFRMFAETLWKDHPYRLDVLGQPQSVKAVTRRQLAAFFHRHFTAAGMTLAVVGDVEPSRVLDKAAGLLAGQKRALAAVPVARARSHPAEPAQSGPVVIEKVLARQQAHLVVGFPGTTIDHDDRFALEVLATVLSGQGGRLFVELRDRQGLAYRVNAFSLEGIDPGYFAVYIACSPEKLETALEGIRVELAKVTSDPIPRSELERAKRYLVGSHEISLQRRATLASTLAFHEAYGLGFDEYKRYAPAILAVDARRVQRTARRYLDFRRAVIARVRPP